MPNRLLIHLLINFGISFCTSFSEAPAEYIFSIYDNVIHGRETISVKHATSLVRLRMQGPGVSTKASVELSKSALRRHSEWALV